MMMTVCCTVVAVYCSVLQCVAVCYNVIDDVEDALDDDEGVLWVALYCNVLQCDSRF